MDGERMVEGEQVPSGESEGTARPARRRRITPLVVVVGTVLVVALGVGAVYAYTRFLARPPVSNARLLPASTLAYFSFDAAPDGRQGEAADRLRRVFEAQPGFREAWDRLARPLSDALGSARQERPTALTLGTRPGRPERATPAPGSAGDLSQYLGGKVTLAVLPLGSDDLQKLRGAALGTGPGEPETAIFDVIGRNVVALVDLDFDALSKRGLLSDLKRWAEQPSQAAVAERYRDMDVRRFDSGTSAVYFALVDGSSTAIVGAELDPVRIVIDTLRDGRSLSSSVTHSGLVREVPSEQLASLYVNLSEVYRSLRLADPEEANTGPVRDLRGGVLLTLGAYDRGLQLDVATEADMTLLPSPDLDFDGPGGIALNPDVRPEVATLGDVPLDAQAFLVGADLRTPLEDLLEIAQRNKGSNLAAQLREFEGQMGLDLETGVAPLLSGDYVLSARLKQAADGSFVPSVLFELKLSNEATARDVFDKFAAARGDTKPETIAGATFHVAGDGFAYGTVARRAWVAWEGDGKGARESLARATDGLGKGIVKTPEWREKALVLPRYSNVIAHVDAGAVLATVEGNSDVVRDRQAYERNIAPFLRPVRYVLIGSASYAAQRVYLSRNHTVVFLGVGD